MCSWFERLVVDVAGDVLLFEAADAMLESRRAGNGPRPRERFGIAAIRLEIFRIRFEMHRNFREVGHGWNLPRLRAIREITVGENDDRDHVLDGDAAGFERDPETVAGSGGRKHGNRSFGVPAEERLK